MTPHASSPFSGKTILVVNTGWAGKRFIFQKMKKLGLTVVVLNKEKNWAEPYVDHWIFADTTNHTESIQAVRTFVKTNPHIQLDGIITFWEDDVLITSKLVDRFNAIGVPYGIAKNVRNKFRLREFCAAHGVRVPRHILVRASEDLAAACEQM